MRGTAALQRTLTANRRARILEARWQELCLEYLPRAAENSIWRYDAAKSDGQPSCGWKLHVSATILNASSVLDRIAPLLIARGVSFKAPRSLVEVSKINSGLDYQYGQVGKIFTIYPRTETEALFLARRLHQLTKRLGGPPVPFDLRFADNGNVYYRYGAFEPLEIRRGEGRKISAVYAPGGDLVPDVREQPKPDWVSDPFEKHKPKSAASKDAVPPSLRVLHVLAQRGKGGVYVAVDLSSQSPRLCLLKEGRKNGEVTWDGRDGACRVRNEKQVLSRLSAAGIAVPRVISSFAVRGNYYLLMEFIDGQTLHEKLWSRSRRLSIRQVANYGLQLAQFIDQVHRAGWCWRDCKPKNIIVTRKGRLVPIDFEGSSPLNRPDPIRWGTPGFSYPKLAGSKVDQGIADDAYALGSILFLLLTGRVYDPERPLTIQTLRKNVPAALRDLVQSLLAIETAATIDIRRVSERLSLILQNSERSGLTRGRA